MAKRPTILIEKNGVFYKVCKVWFGSDGSYYVTVPYHPAKRAILLKHTVRYGPYRDRQLKMFDNAVDIGVLDDDEARVKLSHHPDGFCQFSGDGVISGKDEQGRPKGIAVNSSPLKEIGRGPAFGIVLQGIEVFQTQNAPSKSDMVFHFDDLNATEEQNGFFSRRTLFSTG